MQKRIGKICMDKENLESGIWKRILEVWNLEIGIPDSSAKTVEFGRTAARARTATRRGAKPARSRPIKSIAIGRRRPRRRKPAALRRGFERIRPGNAVQFCEKLSHFGVKTFKKPATRRKRRKIRLRNCRIDRRFASADLRGC